MVILAEKPEVLQRGLAAVLFVDYVMNIRGGCRAIATAWPGAVLIPQDDGAADLAGGNSMLVEFTLEPEGDERTRLRVVESGHELRTWPDAEKQRYADEHQDGWGEFLDRLGTLVAKRQSE
jgi:hypothetical protein